MDPSLPPGRKRPRRAIARGKELLYDTGYWYSGVQCPHRALRPYDFNKQRGTTREGLLTGVATRGQDNKTLAGMR
jgi:hypothetical protein